MKNAIYPLIAFLLSFSVTGCTQPNGSTEAISAQRPSAAIEQEAPATDIGPNTFLPQLKIEGIVYYFNGNRYSNIHIAESDYLGRVEAVVPLSQPATENGQANFLAESGAPYAKYNDFLVVLWNEEWAAFVTKEEVLK